MSVVQVWVSFDRALDEVVEDLVELRVERRLVGEARELREELADGAALVAGQVEPDLAVHDRLLRHVPEHRGIG